jgi:hypothetical protein
MENSFDDDFLEDKNIDDNNKQNSRNIYGKLSLEEIDVDKFINDENVIKGCEFEAENLKIICLDNKKLNTNNENKNYSIVYSDLCKLKKNNLLDCLKRKGKIFF